MVIYYTHNYENTKGESHRLLQKAVSAYAEETGQDAPASADRIEDILRKKGEFGKPYIPGFAPFSISHSNHTWAVLISSEGPECGLDIQYERKVDAASLARRFYAPEDAEVVADLAEDFGEDDRRVSEAFFRIWTRREALVKAAGSSVAGSDVPSVSGDLAEFGGSIYMTEDIHLPDSDASAAVCVMCGCEEPCLSVAARIEFREL